MCRLTATARLPFAERAAAGMVCRFCAATSLKLTVSEPQLTPMEVAQKARVMWRAIDEEEKKARPSRVSLSLWRAGSDTPVG